ncbi:MAG TPA: cyclic nucleotide-binding protein, partial [Spirochaetales bacterium]|nr:cyclic nucleotide-binding protein [Spirochaetales bacterium]
MITADSLQRYSLFGGLMNEQIEAAVLPKLVYKDFQFNDVIIQEGQPNDSIYFLLEGSVDVS